MTLYARGYRPYAEGRSDDAGPRGLRFRPIVAEGLRDARSSRSFRRFGTMISICTTINAFLLYFGASPLTEILRVRAQMTGEGVPQATFLQGSMALQHEMTWALTVLVTLFVGCGLVADDVKTRALPLYLARPITPFDYYLGKLLVPISVLAMLVLAPMLFLVLFSVLLQPTETMWDYLAQQRDVILAALAYFAAVALAYSSLILLFSAWTSRRIYAVVLGAVTLLGGEMVRNAASPLEGVGGDVIRASSLVGDTVVVLYRTMGQEPSLSGFADYPSTGAALAAIALVVLAAAFFVLRRARTTEVAG